MTDAPEKPTWEELAELIRWFVILFGQPADILGELAVDRRYGLLIRGWLASLEAFARALLVMMAAEAPKPAAVTRRPARRKPAVDPSSEHDADAHDPDCWNSDGWTGVSFALLTPSRPETGTRTRSAQGLPFIPTARLAFRFEALIRVAKNPDRYAARMARLLHAKPRLACRILREPRPPGCRSAPREAVGCALAFAWFATEAFPLDTG